MNALPPMIAKRWERRVQHWSRWHDIFDPTRYGVDIIRERDARAFVLQHHYAGSYPASRLAVGLLRTAPGRCDRELAGVAVFSVPVNERTIPRYTTLDPRAGVELGRFVLLPDTGFNAETWFLARAFEVLRAAKREVRAVVSYADPVERTDHAGGLVKPQHWGTIYQAHNARFGGRSSAETLLIAPDGQIVNRRALSKLRLRERGWEGATARLVAAGAPPRRPFEEPVLWLNRVMQDPRFRRIRHPGNLVYAFALDRDARRVLERTLPGWESYPRAAA